MAIMMSITQKEPFQGVIKCQAIMTVYGLSGLGKRWTIKCHWKVATRAQLQLNLNKKIKILSFQPALDQVELARDKGSPYIPLQRISMHLLHNFL